VSETPAPDEAEAHRLVGKFLQNYALLEQALDAGIGKLLKLEGAKNDIVCANIPFAKKIGVLFSAEEFLSEVPDAERKKKLKKLWSTMEELNQKRVMFAHNSFSSDGKGGISFRRVVAKKKLEVSDIPLTSKQVEKLCTDAVALAFQIEELVSDMKPFEARLDFSDPRNSGNLALLF
jgi:predicted ester cyclase